MYQDLPKELGISQTELARFIGISNTSLSSYNSGRRPIPRNAKNVLHSLWQIIHFGWTHKHQSPETDAIKARLEQEKEEYRSFLKSKSEALLYELKQEKLKIEDNYDDAQKRHFKLNVALKEMPNIPEGENAFVFLLRHKAEQDMIANGPKVQFEIQRKIDEVTYWLNQL